MKSFSCGDGLPGCQRRFTTDDENGILAAVAAHATSDHGLASVSPELVDQVRGRITG